jgi:predicted aspartyl protease
MISRRPLVRALLFVAALGLAPAAGAECLPSFGPPDAEAEEGAVGRARDDGQGRMVAPVTVNGRGPYRFIVDTGANRSVLSQGVADRLGLRDVGIGTIHTLQGVTTAPLVEVETLEFGGLDIPTSQMPVLGGAVLAGEQGLLGVDGMVGRRLRLDFERRCIEISPSRTAPPLSSGWTRLRGELRFGHLVVVRGRIRGLRVNVLLDTGSSVSIANTALRDALGARVRRLNRSAEASRAYTAGEPIVLDTAIAVPRLDLNQLSVNDLVLYVGDFHVFTLWGMTEEPTLLIGMDVLSVTRGVAIDFERGSVHFRLHERARRRY